MFPSPICPPRPVPDLPRADPTIRSPTHLTIDGTLVVELIAGLTDGVRVCAVCVIVRQTLEVAARRERDDLA